MILYPVGVNYVAEGAWNFLVEVKLNSRDVPSYGNDHLDFRGSGFRGPVLGSGEMQNTFNLSLSPAASPSALKSLPKESAKLIGRDAHVTELLELLDPVTESVKTAVVSAVSGLAGIGKTALCLHAAHRARENGWFPGGTIFMDLHGYDPAGVITPERALGPLLRALGVPDADIPAGFEDQIRLYLTCLADLADRQLPVLLVLDNVSTAAQVEPLLPGQVEHRVLVTSRHTLATLPARLIDLETLKPVDARGLISRSLLDARPDDERPVKESECLDSLARLCGFLPLALHIATALLKAEPYRSISSLVSDLKNSETRLQELQYSEDGGRSLAVKAAFDLSYARLEPDCARLFRLLSLCPGQDVSLEAAAALTGLPASQVRRLLSGLARAHLIEPISVDRWRAHDLIVLYASELSRSSDDSSDLDQALDRLLKYYQVKAHAADEALKPSLGNGQESIFATRSDALYWFDQERPNLMEAVKRAADTKPKSAWSLALHLKGYLAARHHFDDSMENAQAAINIARDQGWRAREGVAYKNLGHALMAAHSYVESAKAYQKSADIFAEVDDRHQEAHSLADMGHALASAWRHEDAIDALRQAVGIFSGQEAQSCEAHALARLGTTINAHGSWRNDEAIEAHQKALEIFRRIGDRRGQAISLDYIGSVMVDQGRLDEAIEMQREALEIFREHHRRDDEMVVLNNLGNVLRRAGRLSDAVTAHEGAVKISRELDDVPAEARYLNNLGLDYSDLGEYDKAIGIHSKSLELCQNIRDLHYEGHVLWRLADALIGAGRHGEAAPIQRRASDIFQRTGVHNRHKRDASPG